MKTTYKSIIMALVLVIAGSSAMNAQRGMGMMMHDSARMAKMMRDTAFTGRHGYPMMQMRHMNSPRQGQMCPGCGMGMRQGGRYGMGPGAHRGMRPGMGWGPGPGNRGGMGPGQFNRPDFNRVPGQARIENIPNLTDKQKKEIADLRQKQMDDLKKLRDESMSKMKALREDHRKKVMSLLTDEQKKFVEANTVAPAPGSGKPRK
jgi:hypothetical protein